MHQTTDLSLFCLHSASFLRKLYIHSYTSSWLFFTVSNTTKMPQRRAVLKVGQNESIIQLYLGSGTNKVILVNIIVLLEKIEGCTE